MFKNLKLLKLSNSNLAKRFSIDPMRAAIKSKLKTVDEKTPIFQEELKNLKVMWPNFKNEVLDFTRDEKLDFAQINHIDRMMEYNAAPFGKLFRGSLLAFSYKTLAKNNYSEKDLKRMYALSWAIEMIQANTLMQDDICDNGKIRRGQPCWHTLEDVGLSAINDSMFLFGSGYYLVETYIKNPESILKLLNRATLKVSLGQILDMKSSKMCISEFNMKMLDTIAENKTSFWSVTLPIQAAMVLAEYNNPQEYHQVEIISLKMGNLFQMMNDYLDLFGDIAKTGKIGTDIQENKCTLFAVNAYENANEAQRRILNDSYGHEDPKKVARVKEIFDELNVENAYRKYEKEQLESIDCEIQKLTDLPKSLFSDTVEFLYNSLKMIKP